MLTRTINYTDFNDVQKSGVYHFHLSKAELVELEVSVGEGFGEMLQRIVAEQDRKALIEHFKRLVLLAYGVKTPDGNRFVKNEQLREEFSQTAAYQALFVELATDDESAATFITGIMPRDLQEQAAAANATAQPLITPVFPPPPPAV